MILILVLIGLAAAGYYVLYTQGAFQTKEDVYSKTNSPAPEMKCAAGKCGAAMEKMDTKTIPEKKCASN